MDFIWIGIGAVALFALPYVGWAVLASRLRRIEAQTRAERRDRGNPTAGTDCRPHASRLGIGKQSASDGSSSLA